MSDVHDERRFASHDSAARRKAQQSGQEKGCRIYIPGPVLAEAGWDIDGPPPFYRLRGYRRSAKGRSVIVTLYDEP